MNTRRCVYNELASSLHLPLLSLTPLTLPSTPTYKRPRTTEQLEEEHSELTENTKLLADDLECISNELDQMKKKMESKSSSVTDATPLVDIRAAIQRLKKENKEMDIRIGVLDYELIQARMAEAKGSQELSTSRGISDDEESGDDEEEEGVDSLHS